MFKLIYIALLTVLISSLDARPESIDDLESLLNSAGEYNKIVPTGKARSFSIKPDENVLINLNYKPAKSGRRKPGHKKSKSQSPQYYLNFTFQNYKNPKEDTKKKPNKNQHGFKKNQFTDFPLKGEDP
ncbi:PREDICTED: uncharacterized protein LOC108610251 [Drosophila arizonae]|uniref:Uncharacterized protein LOC108610251 n=1 Tax=Drosophila arizonae TaxID=7263 RepID=A0ABM1NRZ4_DROAR|nr:PREDICTED: uncharacterized protein LOC108610251 [Drosophila arizonae]